MLMSRWVAVAISTASYCHLEALGFSVSDLVVLVAFEALFRLQSVSFAEERPRMTSLGRYQRTTTEPLSLRLALLLLASSHTAPLDHLESRKQPKISQKYHGPLPYLHR